MTTDYKLTYFTITGKGEPIRFLFLYGGIAFEDVRIDYHTEWPKYKTEVPYGQLPLLEHNGKIVNQSIAIARYVGKLVGLSGKDDWENLEIDAIVDTIVDFRTHVISAFFEKDPNIKKRKDQVLLDETIPYYLQRFDAIVGRNNGFFALGRLTWADFVFVAYMPYLVPVAKPESILDKYANLVALRERIRAIPAIKKWLDVRENKYHF